MLGMFKKAGESIRKTLLLANKDDGYADDYYDDEDYYDDDEYEEDPMQEHYSPSAPPERKVPEKPAAKARSFYSDKIVELGYTSSASAPQKNAFAPPPIVPSAVIAHPQEIKDASKICDDICSGKMVIVDLTSLDSVNAQRIADYLGGVVHTLQGNTKRVNKGIFVISPREYEISMCGEDAPPARDFAGYRAAR